MAKIAFNSPLLRRAYTVSAENVKVAVQSAGSAMRKVADLGNNKGGGGGFQVAQKEVSWIRDPKSGNWVPETHSGDDQLDAVDLRNKFCFNKNKF